MATYNSLTSRSEAAALIPEEASRTIIQKLPSASAALSTFRRVTLTRAQQRLPVLATLPTAYWVDGSSDTGLKQTSEIGWENKYLDVRELAVIIPVPQAVIDDADFDIWGEITPRLVEAFGAALDAATLFGTNNPWPQTYQQGIVVQAQTAGNNVLEGAGVDFAADVSNAFGKVEEDGYDVNTIYARRKVRARLRNLRAATTNEPIYQDISAGSPPTLYGEPITWVGNDPWVNNYELIVGDRNEAILGVRQDFSVKIFDTGVIQDGNGAIVTNLLQQDAVALRAVGRFAFAVATPATRDNPVEADRFPFSAVINAGS